MQAIANIVFVSDSRYTWNTPYRVWFDLNNFLTRQKVPIFKIRYSRKSQISVQNTYFYPRQAIPNLLFVIDCGCTGDAPCRNWFDLNNFLTRRKIPIFKIRYSRNSQISLRNTNFFPRQAIPKTGSVSYSNYKGDTP